MKGKPNLSITVKDAKLLYDIDEQKGKGKQDPFAIIQLGAQKQKTKTATNQGKLPVWNETFQFVYDPKNPNLKVSVWDTDPQKKNSEELIGEGILNLEKAETAPEWILQLPLYKGGQNDMGSINLEFDFIGKQKPPKKEQSEQASQPPKSSRSLVSNKNIDKSKQEIDNFQYNTIDGDAIQRDLEEQINKIKNTQYTSTFQYLQESRLNMAIQKALNQVAENNPEDQIDYFADCLLQFK